MAVASWLLTCQAKRGGLSKDKFKQYMSSLALDELRIFHQFDLARAQMNLPKHMKDAAFLAQRNHRDAEWNFFSQTTFSL